MNTTAFIDRISTLEWVVIALYLVFFIVQLIYYLYLFRKLYQHAKENAKVNDIIDETKLPGISLIITAKNEAENLRRNLPFILNQDYPNLQIIAVDNTSTDTTADVLDGFRNSHPNLYVTFIPIGSHAMNNKKLALTVGIKAAKHDILLFTEPDTKPLSNKWVYEYAKTFKKGIDVVLGCCQLEVEKSYFKKYIQFDNLFSGIKYTSMALLKKPFMGIGRNLAFRKNLFFDNNGLSSVLNIEDGEDNVFINRIVNKKNTVVVSSPESMVTSNAVDGIINWRNIKSRYLTTRKYYTGNSARILSFEIFSRYLFYVLFVALCAIAVVSSLKFIAFYAALLFLVRYAIQILVINKNSKIYNAGSFYLSLPFMDLVTPIVDHLFLKKEMSNKKR